MTKTVKRLTALILSLLMLLSLAACDKTPAASDAESADNPASADPSSDFWDDPSSSDPVTDDSSAEGPVQSGDSTTTPASSGSQTTKKPSDNSGSVSQVVVEKFTWPKIKATGKTVRVMTTKDVAESAEVKNKLKSQYGLTLTEEYVGWGELPNKLVASVQAQQAPDLVRYRSDNPDMPSFMVKNLVQPIDGLINFKEPAYKDLLSYYDQTKWGGKHYLLIGEPTLGTFVFYNKKLFNDYGVKDDPWKLYKEGKWNWDSFAAMALKFKDDTDGDGEQDRYGFTLSVPPSALLYTTGESFGKLDNANKKITNNIKSANLARAMNLLHELCFTKKSGLNQIATGYTAFHDNMAAMQVTEILNFSGMISSTGLASLAKKGQLGIVPLPKDPKANGNYYLCRLNGWFIPRTASNPMGAIAYNAVQQYYRTDKATVASTEAAMKKAGYTDEHITQLRANWTNGKPVFEFCPFIGYDSVWLSLQNQVAWATQIAQDASKVQATIDDIFTTEVEKQTGPKVIDNFEKYGTNTNTAINKYSPMTGGATTIAIYIDKKVKPYQGKYNGRIDYTLTGSDTYAALTRSINGSWDGNTKLTFWASSDGKGAQKMQVQIRSGGAPFNCMIEVPEGGKEFALNFSDFKLADWYPDKSAKLNLQSIDSLVFNFETKTTVKRSVYIDMIEAKS